MTDGDGDDAGGQAVDDAGCSGAGKGSATGDGDNGTATGSAGKGSAGRDNA